MTTPTLPKPEERLNGTKPARRRGQFAPGNPGGPGRPPRVVEERYREAFQAACTPEAFEQVVRRIVEAALAGDVGAARLLLSNALPPAPPPASAPDAAAPRFPLLNLTPEELNKRREELRAIYVR